MKTVSTEKLIERMKVDLYPITLVKFMLNRRRILSYFAKAAEKDFEIRGIRYKVDPTDCEICNTKEGNMLCRQHTSIQRVLKAKNVAFDMDTNTYLCENEIFRMVGDRLVIVYCPHPKLISGEITDTKVRKINTITIEDSSLELPDYEYISEFLSTELIEQNLKCWFNDEFSIVITPNDRNSSNFCLVTNH